MANLKKKPDIYRTYQLILVSSQSIPEVNEFFWTSVLLRTASFSISYITLANSQKLSSKTPFPGYMAMAGMPQLQTFLSKQDGDLEVAAMLPRVLLDRHSE